ncbi:MAG: hypothetical protein ETSY2_08255 [Candidatus Entotheonella gemina]|uniref:Sortilin N-terminal domain-containing protein n=1 Tax=Candidatus Entotheonella gemina TaxID=1429439 RepID=W4MC61_9BACT|nr:MAG: hypothetical protein ETSY2_08255 [Candidatus Entotheonella gemina]
MSTHQPYVYTGLGGEGDYIDAGGLYRCADGDTNWEPLSAGLPEHPQVRALAMHPSDPNILYAGTQAGVYRSDDQGEHWEALEAPRAGQDVWSLTFHPQNPDILYAGYEPCAIYRSEDSGAHWQCMHTDDVIFPHITTVMPPLCKRVIGIAIDPSDPQDMYAAIEVGGLLASRDGGASWASITNGPYVRNNTLDLHGVQVSAAEPGVVHIVTQIAMFRGRNRGQLWEHEQVEDLFPGGSYCRDLRVAPDDPNTLYMAAGAGGGGAPKGTPEAGVLFRSRDLGASWHRVDIGETPPSRMASIAFDAANPSRIYCCAQRGQVYGSQDGGESWQANPMPLDLSRSRHIYAMVCG